MLIELHIIQNFAPSCLNRDDTNTPKECIFGGYRRARISSQCIKRSIRVSDVFKSAIGENIGIRTKRIVPRVIDMLRKQDLESEKSESIADACISNLYGKSEKGKTKVALYISEREIEAIVNAIKENWTELNENVEKAKAISNNLKKQITDLHTADIALFGRMVAETPNLHIDAASQVAHAISTNRLEMEMDFYTAVDDLLPDEELGAGMMGIIEYNSSCFYRYSNINVDQLIDNLHGDEELAAKVIRGFLHASIVTTPSAKQNSMAAQNPPSFVMALVKNNGFAWSLSNAFAKPVSYDKQNSLIENSVAALDQYWQNITNAFGSDNLDKVTACQIGVSKLKYLEENQTDNIDSLLSEVMASIQNGG